MAICGIYGYRIRSWGDTCGGIHELAVIVIQSSGGHPNRGSALKFGAACPLVVFFASEFFGIFVGFFFFVQKFPQLFSI
jgi:hypothetical protein